MGKPGGAESGSARQTGISTGRMFGYGAGNIGLSMLGVVIVVHLPFLYTDYAGLSAGATGMALLLAKLFDAGTDPVMGYVSDSTNTRWGRRRPYFVAAAIPLGIAFYFLFSPPVFEDPAAHQGYLRFYMLACYMTTYFVWTIAAIPYYSLGAELTDDYHERVKLYAIRETCALLGLLTATILPGILLYSHGGREGYSVMAAFFGLVVMAFLILAGVITREREGFRGRTPMKPYSAWVTTFRNPHFRTLLLAYVFSSMAAATPAILVIYIATYIVGTPEWWQESVPGWLPTWSLYLAVYFGAGIVSLPFWNRMAQSVGKRTTWGFALLLAIPLSAMCALLHEGSVTLYFLVMGLGGITFGNYLALPPSMVADIIDWDETQTGLRREGSYFSIWAFTYKLCTAVTGFAVLMTLHRVGYTPGVAQSEVVKDWMLGMYAWFPATLYAIALIMLSRYRFSQEDLNEVQKKLGRAY